MAMTSMNAARARGWRPRPSRAALLVVAAGATALTLFASACGGSHGPGVAQVGATTTGSAGSGSNGSANPAAYSACMRRHGVPNFPDPDSKGRLDISSGLGIDPSSPQFRAAQRACERLLPHYQPSAKAQAEFLKQALKYSQCMRKHGVPKFPDPQSSGSGVGLRITKDSGIDPNSPQFKAAQKACKALLPGHKGHKTPEITTGKMQGGGSGAGP